MEQKPKEKIDFPEWLKRQKKTVTANLCRPTKLEISVSLEKYAMFSSNSEVTFTIEGEDHQNIIDQLIEAVKYFSDQYQGLVKLE